MARTKLDAACKRRLFAALEKGVTHRVAAAAAGISERTLYLWLERGRKARSGRFKTFVEEFEAKESEVAERLFEVVMTGALTGVRRDKKGNVIGVDSTDARWLLQNRYGVGRAPHDRQRIHVDHVVEVKGSPEAPIQIEHTIDLVDLAGRLAAADDHVITQLASWDEPQDEQEPEPVE